MIHGISPIRPPTARISGESREDGVGPLGDVLSVERRDPDDERGDDGERAEVHRAHRRQQEDPGEDEDRDDFYGHVKPPGAGTEGSQCTRSSISE
jgi:hypothetical protein